MVEQSRVTRRNLLRISAFAGAAVLLGRSTALGSLSGNSATPAETGDDQFLDDVERASFEFFWNEAGKSTGQVKDRALLSGNDTRPMSSIAATGFGLTALCIADRRGYRKTSEIIDRTKKTLRFVAHDLHHEHGFFYHFIDMNSGDRGWKCEISSIDTSLLLCGVLTARQHFRDAEIQDLATRIYERVDWPWMLNGGKTFSMGWRPESGFLAARWDHYCELMMIYLLAIGSPTHPVSPETWQSWSRPVMNYQGIEYISGHDPLFTHQFSHAWYDFRGKRDAHADYFENSIKATKAHKLFCLSLHNRFPDYTDDLWGITSSDSAKGYRAWGGPPELGDIDGTVVPCATGGSLPFLYDDCLNVLRNIRGHYGNKGAWGRYGFVDAFNPLTNWYNPDVIGIDVGITMLMAENKRTGFVWETFMKNKEAQTAMEKAGFRSTGVNAG
jgi:hypothetical protein